MPKALPADRSWPSLPDLAFDLLTRTIVSHSLYAATEQDKTIGKKFVIEVRRGDLVLRDMGYFSLSEFTAIELLEAWWLTRLQLITGVMLADGRILGEIPQELPRRYHRHRCNRRRARQEVSPRRHAGGPGSRSGPAG